MTLTTLEIQMLKAICSSQYNDGTHPLGGIGVWFENPFGSKQTASGVCASLTTKKAAWFEYAGTRDHAMGITKEGFEALNEVEPEFTARFKGWGSDPFPVEFYKA